MNTLAQLLALYIDPALQTRRTDDMMPIADTVYQYDRLKGESSSRELFPLCSQCDPMNVIP